MFALLADSEVFLCLSISVSLCSVCVCVCCEENEPQGEKKEKEKMKDTTRCAQILIVDNDGLLGGISYVCRLFKFSLLLIRFRLCKT